MKAKLVRDASVWCVLFVLAWACCDAARAQDAAAGNNLAPGAPGAEARWPSAGKNGVGTSNTLESKVWFTLRGGVLTEIYYPTVDVANSQELQFVVVTAGGRVETESDDATHRLEITDARSLSFRQINTARSGAWSIVKTYTTDPARHTVLVEVQFKSRAPAALYVYYDPSMANSGLHDSAWTQGDALLASDAGKTSALLSSTGFTEMTNGYLGTSDGLMQLRRARGRITNRYMRAADGNVVQMARVQAAQTFTLALGFGAGEEEALGNARASLARGFARVRADYERGWHEYLASLRRVEARYQAQFDMAAMILRAHEDKTYRGANIASLSVPWGGGATANEPNVGGYHLVWSRDLYQVATALHAIGDKAGADRALNYLFKVQQKADGSFPQNSWLDGRPFWGSLQLDEVAFPLILAYTLGRTDNETWTKHVRPAADFIVRTGPRTPQERWEEKAGYSPSTIAAEIAGLVCAAEIARRNDAHASAGVYLAVADEWARNVERWTVTSTGMHGDGNYYIRIAHTDDDPNDADVMNAGNGGGDYDEREYVDAGFLELVRLGIKRADDPLIAKSLAVVDKVIKVETPNGAAWYRYNHDGYGEMDDGRPWNFDGKYTGKGRLWALLAGERGQYELARGERAAARMRLEHMLGFANDGLMLPEQIWDRRESPSADFVFGEGTGSATPLAWSMAQFIRLAANLAEGRNLETPDIVAARYTSKTGAPADAGGATSGDAEEVWPPVEAGTVVNLSGGTEAGTRVYALVNGEAREVTLDEQGRGALDVRVPEGDSTVVIGIHKKNGATAFRRITLRGLTKENLRASGEGGAGSESASPLAPAFVERLRKAERSPIVEEDQVTFLYRGKAKRVEAVGDFTSWSPRRQVLRELAGTDLKYLTLKFPRDARVEYKFIADGEWTNDPLNDRKLDNGVGGYNNFFQMPGYRPSALGEAKWDLRGTLEKLEAPAAALEGGKRKLQVYLPPAYARAGQAERFPVLYLQDGSEYVARARAAVIADQLIAQGRVQPFIIVFVDPVNRFKEYWANDGFADFMAKELVPFIDARYRTRRDRSSRALMGASLGGVISVWTALRHPDVFARVAGQSTAFQIDDERVVTALAALEPMGQQRALPLRFYFDVGLLEPIWKVNRRVRVSLAGKGYPVAYAESNAGHNWTSWRDQLAEAFTRIWNE
ncbi:MAG TPA: glucan 1,4-alpha-glucosidase [Pyrinomonadaceae bacterium]|nr:glucan 1,4-alpha-glucosidase [Pyrinomonadaceae bacterium]